MKKTITFSILLTALSAVSYSQNLADVERDIKFEKYDTAKEALYKLIRAEVKPREGRYYYNLGKIHIAQGYNDSASLYFKEGLKAFKNMEVNNIGIGRVSLDEGKDKEARSKFNAALYNIDPRNIEPLLLISRAYMESPKPDAAKAIEYAKKALTAQPRSVEALVTLADAHIADRSTKLAWATLLEAKLVDAESPLLLSAMAKVHHINNEYEDTFRLLNQAIELHPDYEPAYKQLAQAYLDYVRFSDDKSKRADAVKNYAKYHEMIGKSFDADNAYAEFLIKAKDYKTLDELSKKNWLERGDNFPLYKYAGIAAYENGRMEEAYQNMWQYFDVQNKTKLQGIDYMYFGLAEIEKAKNPDGTFNEEGYNKAIANIEAGIKQNPKLSSELHQYGLEMFKEEKFKQAYFLFDIGSKNPKSENYVYDSYYKGNTLYLTSDKPMFQDQLQRASNAFNDAIKASPTTHEAYLLNARTQILLPGENAKTQAEKSYEDFLRIVETKKIAQQADLQEALVEAYSFIGGFNMAKNPEKAKINFEKALRIEPNNQYVKDSLDKLNKEQGSRL